jgi:hypothetical protein
VDIAAYRKPIPTSNTHRMCLSQHSPAEMGQKLA